MNKLAIAFVAINLALLVLKAAQPEINPSHIDAYVTPYYDSKGPVISVGRFSSGLASANLEEFLAIIVEMKKDWGRLTFPELYVAAIRLYDLGYRKEAVYWFIPHSIGADSLVFSWIRPRWEVSVALGLSCCMPRMLFINL
jgi:hypothetical protein